MKLLKVLGVTIAIIAGCILTEKYIANGSIEASSFSNANGEAIADSSVNYDNTVNEDNTSNTNALTFTNKYSKTVDLSSSNITVTCKGTGANKESDEYIAEKNMKVKATFSTEKNGTKTSTLKVEPKGKAYIYVTTLYEGTEYPTNEVNCSYSLAVSAM